VDAAQFSHPSEKAKRAGKPLRLKKIAPLRHVGGASGKTPRQT